MRVGSRRRRPRRRVGRSLRPKRWALVCALLACSACRDKTEPQSTERTRPVLCYRSLERQAPGQLRLQQPVDCFRAVERYRVEGRHERPSQIDYLDAEGTVRLRYRIRRAADGRAEFEERIFYRRPTDVQLYQRGERVAFSSRPNRSWEVVRIRTDLDAAGRSVKTEKYVGASLVYRVERRYDETGLASEATYDGSGKLKFRSVYRDENDRRFETMLDGKGNLLLEREVRRGERSGQPDRSSEAVPKQRSKGR